MSSTPTFSTVEFIRSVLSLTTDPTAPAVDTSLLNPADNTKIDKEFQNSSQSELPSSKDISEDVETKNIQVYTPWSVFVNYVDKFNGKHIARFLSQREYGSLKSPDINVEEEAEVVVREVLYDGINSLFTSDNESSVIKQCYTVIGSVMDNAEEVDKDVVCLVSTKNKNTFFQSLKCCGFIVYDISRYPDQIDEARWVLNKLLKELKKLDSNPSVSTDNLDMPIFILISTFMTWVLTKPVDPDMPSLPFQEMDYKSRQYHPNFKEHYEFENEVVDAGKVFPERFKTLVLCAGIPYGFEEDTLNFLFRMVWENEPALPLFGDGENYVPLVHIEDLAMMLYTVLELFPKKLKYLLAVEYNTTNMKSITNAISRGLSSGVMMKLNNEDMILYDVSQHVYDCLTVNVCMEPAYFAELEEMSWSNDSFVDSIESILKEYRLSRNLHPIRILVIGPPASGKSTLARKLCEYYELHYINEKRFGEISVEKIRETIDMLKANQDAALEKTNMQELRKEDEKLGEETEEDEILENPPVEYIFEGRQKSIETLCAKIQSLTQIMELNDGVLDNDKLFHCANKILSSSEIINQGFVLDGFPENIEQAQNVFQNHNFDSVHEEENHCVDYVIVLQASVNFIIDRVLSLSEEEIQDKGYGEESLLKRLTDYQSKISDEFELVQFMTHQGIQTITIPVEEDKSVMMQETFDKLRQAIGKPCNFEMTEEEKEEERKEKEEARKLAEAQELARKQDVERKMHIERLKKLEEWAMTMDSLREEEEEVLAESSGHIRHYLNMYIFPTLTRGLLEVARLRPEDPLDFLAEYLFQNNPEGKILEPDDTHQYRKLFKTINKDIEVIRKVAKATKNTESARDIEKEEEEVNILDLQVGQRPPQTYY